MVIKRWHKKSPYYRKAHGRKTIVHKHSQRYGHSYKKRHASARQIWFGKVLEEAKRTGQLTPEYLKKNYINTGTDEFPTYVRKDLAQQRARGGSVSKKFTQESIQKQERFHAVVLGKRFTNEIRRLNAEQSNTDRELTALDSEGSIKELETESAGYKTQLQKLNNHLQNLHKQHATATSDKQKSELNALISSEQSARDSVKNKLERVNTELSKERDILHQANKELNILSEIEGIDEFPSEKAQAKLKSLKHDELQNKLNALSKLEKKHPNARTDMQKAVSEFRQKFKTESPRVENATDAMLVLDQKIDELTHRNEQLIKYNSSGELKPEEMKSYRDEMDANANHITEYTKQKHNLDNLIEPLKSINELKTEIKNLKFNISSTIAPKYVLSSDVQEQTAKRVVNEHITNLEQDLELLNKDYTDLDKEWNATEDKSKLGPSFKNIFGLIAGVKQLKKSELALARRNRSKDVANLVADDTSHQLKHARQAMDQNRPGTALRILGEKLTLKDEEKYTGNIAARRNLDKRLSINYKDLSLVNKVLDRVAFKDKAIKDLNEVESLIRKEKFDDNKKKLLSKKERIEQYLDRLNEVTSEDITAVKKLLSPEQRKHIIETKSKPTQVHELSQLKLKIQKEIDTMKEAARTLPSTYRLDTKEFKLLSNIIDKTKKSFYLNRRLKDVRIFSKSGIEMTEPLIKGDMPMTHKEAKDYIKSIPKGSIPSYINKIREGPTPVSEIKADISNLIYRLQNSVENATAKLNMDPVKQHLAVKQRLEVIKKNHMSDPNKSKQIADRLMAVNYRLGLFTGKNGKEEIDNYLHRLNKTISSGTEQISELEKQLKQLNVKPKKLKTVSEQEWKKTLPSFMAVPNYEKDETTDLPTKILKKDIPVILKRIDNNVSVKAENKKLAATDPQAYAVVKQWQRDPRLWNSLRITMMRKKRHNITRRRQ